MRKHISVLGLWIRCSLYKILGILAIMSITEYMLFYFTLNNERLAYEATGTFSRPEAIIDHSGIFLCFSAAFIVITMLLSIYGCQFGSKTSYTLQRLSINEKYVFLYQKNLKNFLFYSIIVKLTYKRSKIKRWKELFGRLCLRLSQ